MGECVPECEEVTDCDDGLECTVDTCVDGACGHMPRDSGRCGAREGECIAGTCSGVINVCPEGSDEIAIRQDSGSEILRYVFCDGGDSEIEWEEARMACEAAGGYLARIDSLSEHEWLGSQTSGDVWIGYRDVVPGESGAVEEFRWLYGEDVGTFDGWREGRPDNRNCVVLREHDDMPVWEDKRCTDSKSFLCEFGP